MNSYFWILTKSDNDIYYGYGIGKGEVGFSGSFQKTDININATTGKGSKLSIPISYERDASEVKFIKFVSKDSTNIEDNKGKSEPKRCSSRHKP